MEMNDTVRMKHDSLVEYPEHTHGIFLPFTSYTTEPVMRYSHNSLSSSIRDIVEFIDFQNANEGTGFIYVYLYQPSPQVSVQDCGNITDFIMQREEWRGDRSRKSLAAEIFIHWVADKARPVFSMNEKDREFYKKKVIGSSDSRPSPVYPIHLDSCYSGLDESDPMDKYLLRI